MTEGGNYNRMDKDRMEGKINGRRDACMRLVAREYVSFVKKSRETLRDARRAAILAMGRIAGLKDGDEVEVRDDGSYKIIRREGRMDRDIGKDGALTLNGREVTREELERQREAASSQKGARLEETSPGKFQMRLED